MNYLKITKNNIDKEHICCAMSGKQSLVKKEWLKKRFEEGLVFYRSEECAKQRNGAKYTCTSYDIRIVSGWRICNTRDSIR